MCNTNVLAPNSATLVPQSSSSDPAVRTFHCLRLSILPISIHKNKDFFHLFSFFSRFVSIIPFNFLLAAEYNVANKEWNMFSE